jgi:hypothetical protein
MRILGLALVAVFALVAISAASASAAEPAFYECAKVTGGKYEKGCGKEGGKGGYEIKEGIGKKGALKGKSGPAKLETPGLGAVTCTGSKDSGVVTSPTHISKIVTEYKGCETQGKKCASPGEKAGTIKTNNLEGELGYINKSSDEVGVDIKAEGGGNLAEFNCEGLAVETAGSVIGHQEGDINKFSKESSLNFYNTGGKQNPTKLEGGPTDVLETTFPGLGGPFESYQEQDSKNKGEDLEVKAS